MLQINENGDIDIENAYKKFSINKKYRDEYIAELMECQVIGMNSYFYLYELINSHRFGKLILDLCFFFPL